MAVEHCTERDWSDLPSEILSLIIMRLLSRDRASFHCVCRNWQLVPFPTWLVPSWPLSVRFPLVIFSAQSNFKFNHPLRNTNHIMNIPEIARAIIRFSRDGWLLMSQGKHKMFFFNPFTKERIDLPDLPQRYPFNEIAFSCPPTAPGCVVFGTKASNGPDHINFGFIRRGEDAWSICSIANKTLFLPSNCSPIFYKGVFYSLGTDGKLGEFDPNKEEEHCWIVHHSRVPCKSFKRQYLVECNGDLVSTYEGEHGKWVKVYKLDFSNKAWKGISSLGNGMLFLSYRSSFAMNAQVPGMENKIYFPRFNNNNGVFYSLGTGRFHTFWTDFSRDDCTSDIDESKVYSPWIEPNFKAHDDESLQWFN